MGGIGHDFKTGVNFINEPHLFTTFNSGVDDYFYTHLTDEDLTYVEGKSHELVSRLQAKLGKRKRQIVKLLNAL